MTAPYKESAETVFAEHAEAVFQPFCNQRIFAVAVKRNQEIVDLRFDFSALLYFVVNTVYELCFARIRAVAVIDVGGIAFGQVEVVLFFIIFGRVFQKPVRKGQTFEFFTLVVDEYVQPQRRKFFVPDGDELRLDEDIL